MPQMKMFKPLSIALAMLLGGSLLASCTLPKGQDTALPDGEKKIVADIRYQPVAYEELQGWNGDNHGEALISLGKTCKSIEAGEALWVEKLLSQEGMKKAWKDICQIAPQVPQQAAKAFFETAFMPFKVVAGDDREVGKLTAYYTPVIKGSWTRLTPYSAPLYPMPKDLQPGEARYSRQAIADGAIPAADTIVWVNNPVDAFYMQIQGAGEIVMEDGSKVLLEVEGTNGHSWQSPAKKGLNREVLKALVLHQPSVAVDMMNGFPRYVFYKVAPTDQVRGAAEVPLTNERSIAVDNRHIPLGTPVWIDGENDFGAIRKLTIAQDIGGAIKGSVRADLYMGRGEAKGNLARKVNHNLRMYALIPRTKTGLTNFLNEKNPVMAAKSKEPEMVLVKTPLPPVKKAMGKGRYAIQLGAFGNQDWANKQWTKIVKRTAPLLDNVVHKLSSYKTFYRLRAGPLTTRGEATGLCQKLKAVGVDCFPVTGMQ